MDDIFNRCGSPRGSLSFIENPDIGIEVEKPAGDIEMYDRIYGVALTQPEINADWDRVTPQATGKPRCDLVITTPDVTVIVEARVGRKKVPPDSSRAG